MIDYKVGHVPPVDDIVALYRATSLGARRPVDDPARMQRMFDASNVVVTAYDGDKLIGLSRAMSDMGWVCYLADLLVHEDWQGRGVGKDLIRRTHDAAGGIETITLILVSAPEAMTFYPAAGFDKIEEGWRVMRGSGAVG